MSRVGDDERLDRWHAVTDAAFAADFDAFPADPVDERRPALAGRYGDEDVLLSVGEVDGKPVVSASSRMPVHDNLTLGNVDVWVHPDHRRHGYGRAALEFVLDELRATGRTTVLFEIPDRIHGADGSPGEALVSSVGARRMTFDRRRLLDLHSLDRERLTELWKQATDASEGYTRIAWRDRTPDEHLDDLLVLVAAMSTDPPQGDLELEPERWSVERFRRLEQSYLDRGRTRLFVAVRHDASGQLVGYTDIGVPAGSAVGYQWDTIVRADHRGHRLGLLLKIANLHQVRADLPDVHYLNTWNADENAHMVAVNTAVGFVAMEGWGEWQLDL